MGVLGEIRKGVVVKCLCVRWVARPSPAPLQPARPLPGPARPGVTWLGSQRSALLPSPGAEPLHPGVTASRAVVHVHAHISAHVCCVHGGFPAARRGRGARTRALLSQSVLCLYFSSPKEKQPVSQTQSRHECNLS